MRTNISEGFFNKDNGLDESKIKNLVPKILGDIDKEFKKSKIIDKYELNTTKIVNSVIKTNPIFKKKYVYIPFYYGDTISFDSSEFANKEDLSNTNKVMKTIPKVIDNINNKIKKYGDVYINLDLDGLEVLIDLYVDRELLQKDSISEGVLVENIKNIHKNFIRAPKNRKFYKENKQFLHKVLDDCHPIVVGELTKIKNPYSKLQHLEFPSNLLSDIKWLENVDIIGNKIKLLVCGFKVSYLEDWEEIEYNKVVDKCNKNSKIKKYGNIIVEKNIIRHGPEDGIYFSYYIIMDKDINRELLEQDFIYENTFNANDILKEIQPIVDREISKVKFLNSPKGNFRIDSNNITAIYDIPWKLVQLYKKVEDQFDESLYKAIDKIRNNSTINKYFKEVYLKLGKLDFKLEFKYKK